MVLDIYLVNQVEYCTNFCGLLRKAELLTMILMSKITLSAFLHANSFWTQIHQTSHNDALLGGI
jgi:hypothetical protein